MSDIKSISDLKLRLSYGVTGNQGLSSYQSLPQLMPESYPFEDAVSIGYQNAIIENPNLRWERTTQYNVGLDIALFNGRIALTGEYYLKRTADLLQRSEERRVGKEGVILVDLEGCRLIQ